jgi:hypothetical protein
MKISFKAVVAAAAGVALATGLGMGAAAAAASASVRPATVTVNAPTRHTVALEPCGLNVCWMDLSSRFQITTGPSGWTHGTHWSVWNNREAVGLGWLDISDATTWSAGHVTLVLTRPVNGVTISGHKHPYFTRLHIEGGKGIASHWYWNWTLGDWIA